MQKTKRIEKAKKEAQGFKEFIKKSRLSRYGCRFGFWGRIGDLD